MSAAASLTATTLLACTQSTDSAQTGGPDGDPSTGSDQAIATRTMTGGLCAEGPCRDVVTVLGDGTWSRAGTSGAGHGRLSAADLTALRAALEATRLPAAPSASPPCPSAYDGPEWVYGIGPAATTTVSSCDRDVTGDPVVQWWTERFDD